MSRQALRVGLAGALLWLHPGVAAAGSTEMLSLTKVTCSGLTVTGTGLPRDTPLVLSVSERTSSPPVLSVPVRTDAAGSVRVDLRVSLAGFGEVSVAAARPGADTLVIGSQQFARTCPRPQAAGTLATTGPVPYRLLLVLVALGLVALGALLQVKTAYRGTHSR